MCQRTVCSGGVNARRVAIEQAGDDLLRELATRVLSHDQLFAVDPFTKALAKAVQVFGSSLAPLSDE
jgi:hypothetical protein